MALRSILFHDGAPPALPEAAPDYFHDLRLDQIVDAIAARSPDHDLKPYFWLPLHSPAAVAYRQQAMRELDRADWQDAVEAFAQGLHEMRRRLANAEKLYVAQEKQRWFLGAAQGYADAVKAFADRLATLAPRSEALRAAADDLRAYAASPAFTAMAEQARNAVAALADLRFGVIIDGPTATVCPYAGEVDYTPVVASVFAKFRRGDTKDYRAEFKPHLGVDHIQAQVIERVARLYPQPFEALRAFCEAHAGFADEGVLRLDRELQFYAGFLRHIAPLRQAGLPITLPEVSDTDPTTRCADGFDLALAAKRTAAGEPVVCNDFELGGTERILVVSGPNQGGKTTFARMVGQLHHLAALGCMVPARQARLFLCDRIFSHFEREEDIANLRGKLRDDLLRMHRILQAATERSLVVMNESFSSTTLDDAVFLSREVLQRLSGRNLLAVCVTFLAELARFNEKTVSMVSQIDPADPAVRTFKVVRRPADGLAYAMAIARKYRLTRDALLERITP